MNKKLIKKTILVIAAFITTLAIYGSSEVVCLNPSMLNLVNNYNSISLFFKRFEFAFRDAFGIIPLCVFLVVLYFYCSVQNKDKSKRIFYFSLSVAVLMSIILLVCQSFMLYYGLSLVINDGFQLFVSIIKFIGFTALFYHLIVVLFLLINNTSNNSNKKMTSFAKKFMSHPILFIFLIMMIFYIPYIIFYYPGGLNMDSYFQINQFFRNVRWTSHHPIFSTLYYGLFMKLGLFLRNANLGLFIPNLIQVIVSSLLIAYITDDLYRIIKKIYVYLIPIIYFCFIPVWGMHFYTEVKDIPFCLGMLGFVYILMKSILYDKNHLSKKDYYILALSLITMQLFRHNGLHTIILTIPFIVLILSGADRKYISVICISSILFVTILNFALSQILHVPKGSKSEVLSVPLQQTAAYIYEYYDELTEDEKNVISKLYKTDLEEVRKHYNYETIDDTKYYFGEPTSEDIRNYLITWFKMFFKHPKCYIFATINSTYGYIYPDKTEYKDGIALYEFGYIEGIDNGMFDLHRIDSFHDASDVLEQYAYATRNSPIGIIYSCGTYFILLVILSALLICYKKYRCLLPLIPLYTIILTNILSPVNAYIRYVIPIMLCTPFLIIYTSHILKKENPET